MSLKPPAESAGPANLKISDVAKTSRQQNPTRKAMTGVKGSGPVGTDSRPGSFKASIDDIKSTTPGSVAGSVKSTNRQVKGDSVDRRIAAINKPFKPRPVAQGSRNVSGVSGGQAIPHHSALLPGQNDVAAAISRLMGDRIKQKRS